MRPETTTSLSWFAKNRADIWLALWTAVIFITALSVYGLVIA